MKFNLKNRLEGRFYFTKYKADADGNPIPETRQELAEFGNLITNNGLNLLGSGEQYAQYCQLGTGNTAPNINDTALANYLGSRNYLTGAGESTVYGAVSTPPYYGWARRTYRFAAGTVVGNIAEVGVGASAVGNLFSRALILDGGGSPTTITVLADEILDVTYEVRNYVYDGADLVQVININGVNTTFTIRPIGATQATPNYDGNWIPPFPSLPTVPSNTVFVYGGEPTLAAVTAQEMIPQSGATSYVQNSGFGATRIFSAGAYITDSFYRDFYLSLDLPRGNVTPDGMGGIVLAFASFSPWQMKIVPNIPKDADKIFRMDFRISFDRYTP